MIEKREKRPPRPHRGQNAGISREKYNEIYRAFLADQNIGAVAKRCRLDRRTIKHYVEHGDIGRGLRPIRERFVEVVRKAQDLEDHDLAKARAENLSLVREAKQVFTAKLREQLAADGLTLTSRASAELPADVSGAIERLIRLEMTLLGEPDMKVEMTSKFDGWTREELIAYGETGRFPKRARGGKP